MHQHIESFDEHKRHVWRDQNGIGSRIFFGMIKRGKKPGASGAELPNVSLKRWRIESLRGAATTHGLGVELAAGDVVAVQRNDSRIWSPDREFLAERRFAAAGKTCDPNQIRIGSSKKRL